MAPMPIFSQKLVNRLVVAAFLLGFLTLVAVGVAAALVLQRNVEYTDLVSHTYEVQETIAEYGVYTERVETARRGFLITRSRPPCSHTNRRPSGAKAMAVGLARPLATVVSVNPDGNVAAATGVGAATPSATTRQATYANTRTQRPCMDYSSFEPDRDPVLRERSAKCKKHACVARPVQGRSGVRHATKRTRPRRRC